MSLAPALHKLRDKQNLTVAETREIFDAIFSGTVPEEHIAAFLLALRGKGETAEEILGAATSMRAKAITIEAPPNAIDIVGTGGDSKGTLNISTATALVVASCGVPVAKHGNRAATSQSGSSDVLAALGVNLEPSLAVLERCLREANLCFLFAPRHHPAMRHVAAIRKKLGVRTIFNLLGPLTNPANVKRHLIGVFSQDWLLPMAKVLQDLGSESAWLTHGQDGMDEITTTAPSDIVAMQGDEIRQFTLFPQDTGITPPTPEQLLGGDASVNAEAIKKLLAGEKTPYRDIVTLNAAAALVVAEKTADIRQGVTLAAENLDSGATCATLHKVIEVTNRN
ncbi:MAG: anthranilate phosphoribosyltransferase [Alphaproteobacteria bacterium]|nr:anthranilate phosphoribosyltransferase [Alphaproteobacteria bacterium]